MIDFGFIQDFSLSNPTFVYSADVIIIGLAAFLIYRRLKSKPKSTTDMPEVNAKPSVVITSKDIRAIAGDDVMVTQLDLARAYIELGKKKLARQILDHVMKHGNTQQQQSARQLMASL